MKITETRKDIIELIEPYMDKTKEVQIKTNQIFISEEWFYERTWDKILCINFIDTYLGFYDITSIEKYIISKWYEIQIDNDSEWDEKYILYFWKYVGNFNNKPLHLYTEEEDKQLLDLLIKLK